MAKGSLFRSGALAAMAAGLALFSPPVLAQDGPAQWRAQARAERAERSGGERQAPAWRAQRQAPAPDAQAAPRPERAAVRQAQEWQGRRIDDGQRGWRGDDGHRTRQGNDGQRNWRDARPAPAPAVAQAAPVEGQARNRSYADPSRDRSYGGDREGQRREWRDDDRREGRERDWNRDRNRDTWRDDRRDDRDRNWRNEDRRDNSRTYWRGNDNRRWDNDNRRWDRDWRRDNRYNWNSYRHTHRHIYRPGRYYAPYRNYYYRPISIGFYMDSLFLTNRYWINDPWHYRLPPAYGPYRWVRYYDDVLLVDIYSGEVVDVIRNFFW